MDGTYLKYSAAGFAETLPQLRFRQGAVSCGLRLAALRPYVEQTVVALAGCRQRDRLARLHTDGQRYRNLPVLPPVFVLRTRLGEQILGLRRILRTGAEHLRAFLTQPVPVGKPAAGERLLQLTGFLRRGTAFFVEQPPVDAGDDRHIFRALHAALQLEAGHAHLRHLPEVRGEIGVLQTQGMPAPAGAVDPVGQAAGLGAGTPVAAALTHHGAHLALSGVAHTERAVDEDLDLGGTAGADLPHLVPVQLPGQHHPLHAQCGGFVGAAQREQAHLGAGVEGYVRHDFPRQRQKSPVLHQYGVYAHGAGFFQRVRRLYQLPVGQQGVQRQKDPYTP